MTATKLATTMALSGWYLYTYNEFAFKVGPPPAESSRLTSLARRAASLTRAAAQVLGLVSPVAQAVGNTVKRVVILVRARYPSHTCSGPASLAQAPLARVVTRALPLHPSELPQDLQPRGTHLEFSATGANLARANLARRPFCDGYTTHRIPCT
jgi:hypothetical protein